MKFLGLAVAVSLLATTAMAGAPDGQFNYKTNKDYTTLPHGIAQGSAQITQNGQFVSGNGDTSIDQTTYPGSRADIVHVTLSQPGGPLEGK
jgi:hypothetical protein